MALYVHNILQSFQGRLQFPGYFYPSHLFQLHRSIGFCGLHRLLADPTGQETQGGTNWNWRNHATIGRKSSPRCDQSRHLVTCWTAPTLQVMKQDVKRQYIHAMQKIYNDEEIEVILLVDAKNAFNSLNRTAAFRNCQVLCPSLSTNPD